MEAAGRIRLTIEAKLSPGPPMLNLRRHGVNGRWHEIADNVASGNFLGARLVQLRWFFTAYHLPFVGRCKLHPGITCGE